MHHRKQKRARRRESTLKVALRRRHAHLAQVHPDYLRDPSPENVDCICETAPLYYAKRSLGCGCSKKQKGRPKFGRGCCMSHEGARDTVTSRVRTKRLMYALARGWIDMYDVPSPRGLWGI
jgi:hypothetical protein